MKRFTAALSFLFFLSLAGFSQPIPADKVPVKIKQAFEARFPKATDVKYELETRDYEVSFKSGGVSMSADFDPTGKWMETETDIPVKDLPKEVAASLLKNFPGFKTESTSRIETSGGEITYEADIRKDKEKYEVSFSLKGDVLKKKVRK